MAYTYRKNEIEFLKDVPDTEIPKEWVNVNISQFSGDIAIVVVYNEDPEENEEEKW